MHKFVFVAALAAAFGLFVPRGASAPALGDKPVKFEYAELTYTRTLVAPAGQPGAPLPHANPQDTIVWSTSQEEVKAKSWEELADKLKAPAAKKEVSATVQRLRVFDRLGADGWEVIEHTDKGAGFGGVAATWALKRRVP
jgi:hypothetical protein